MEDRIQGEEERGGKEAVSKRIRKCSKKRLMQTFAFAFEGLL